MSREEGPVEVSRNLLAAALGGLLCLAEACSGSSGSATTASTSSTSSPDTPVPSTACDGGVAAHPAVTATTAGALTQAQFEAMCASREGIFEVQPHCGGSNSCRGMSYDSELQTLFEHTCRATNSCGGYSCVVCD